MKQHWAGITAVILGCVALTLTLLALFVVPEPPPQPVLQKTVGLNIGGFHVDWTKTEEAPPTPPQDEPFFTRAGVQLSSYGFAAGAGLLALIAVLRREAFWLPFIAWNLAAAAFAWYVFVVVFFVVGYTGLIGVLPVEWWAKPKNRAETGDPIAPAETQPQGESTRQTAP